MKDEAAANEDVLKIEALIYEAARLEHGRTKIAMHEEAVRLADIYGDDRLRIHARTTLVKAAVFGGEDEKAIVAFSWLCKKYEESPELMSAYQFLWQYKWIIHQLFGFPNVSRAQIDAIFADAMKHYTTYGASPRPIYQNLCRCEMYSGNHERAAEYYRKWQSTPRDFYSDCLACEVNMQVDYQVHYGNDRQALEIAKPILSGKMTCAEIPHCTYANVLLPLVRLGRFEEAEETFQKGYKMVSKNKDFLPQIIQHLRFLVLAGNLENAVRLFEKHISWALDTKHLEHQFKFFNTAWLLLDSLQTKGETSVKLNLPPSFRHFREDRVYDVSDLMAKFETDSKALAELFDARNENDYYAAQLEDNKKLKKWAFELARTPGERIR